MAKMTIGQKAERVLRFLMGLRGPEVATALRRHGFTEADRAEGYERIRRLTDHRLAVPAPPSTSHEALERLDELGATGGPEESRALEHLARRGLDAETTDEARRLVGRLMSPPPASPGRELCPEAVARAEAELWSWFIEWSTIARAVIKSRRQLRLLGYLASKRDADEPDEGPQARVA